MSMSGDELERTGLLKKMLDKSDEKEEDSIDEIIEEFEDRLEYIDIDEDRKKKYLTLIEQIKEERDERVREFLFNQLKKEIEK